MKGANLQKAILKHATLNLKNFDVLNNNEKSIKDAQFDETTILPDGSNWTPETDINKFIDPEHPDYWKPDNPILFE